MLHEELGIACFALCPVVTLNQMNKWKGLIGKSRGLFIGMLYLIRIPVGLIGIPEILVGLHIVV